MGQCFSDNGPLRLHNMTDHKEPEKDLTDNEIVRLFGLVAKELDKAGKNVTIVAIGGAVNTVLLHSRESTTDVDFFYTTKTENEDVHSVVEAAKKVSKSEKLGDQWLNNHTVLFIQEENMMILYNEACSQNREIFRAKGLTVLAAPWHYALTAKIDRLAKVGAKVHDLPDAVTYLHELVMVKRALVSTADLADWARKYKCTQANSDLLRKINEAYVEKYGSQGIDGV
ncbi:hypothetical protein F5890DRAFT_1523212 [Lentinula detonsa]|uniref:DUF7582 domain-containing protein n=1 Tax=Lentinula detonsa TaxID=2804962 RepID=A0AA38PXC2_9AGAR|nr:hypothetical protein F5890DRAFT_1523212 [Lentinula detonsa]